MRVVNALKGLLASRIDRDDEIKRTMIRIIRYSRQCAMRKFNSSSDDTVGIPAVPGSLLVCGHRNILSSGGTEEKADGREGVHFG